MRCTKDVFPDPAIPIVIITTGFLLVVAIVDDGEGDCTESMIEVQRQDTAVCLHTRVDLFYERPQWTEYHSFLSHWR